MLDGARAERACTFSPTCLLLRLVHLFVTEKADARPLGHLTGALGTPSAAYQLQLREMAIKRITMTAGFIILRIKKRNMANLAAMMLSETMRSTRDLITPRIADKMPNSTSISYLTENVRMLSVEFLNSDGWREEGEGEEEKTEERGERGEREEDGEQRRENRIERGWCGATFLVAASTATASATAPSCKAVAKIARPRAPLTHALRRTITPRRHPR